MRAGCRQAIEVLAIVIENAFRPDNGRSAILLMNQPEYPSFDAAGVPQLCASVASQGKTSMADKVWRTRRPQNGSSESIQAVIAKPRSATATTKRSMVPGGTRNSYCSCSSTFKIWSGGTSHSTCRMPLGQEISTLWMVLDPPKPKCTRESLADA